MRVIFQPFRFLNDKPETPSVLIFVGVTDDEGNTIPADKLEWLADGEHEALVIGSQS